MSGSQSIGKILGASSATVGGIAVLPKTSGSFVLSAVAVTAILSGIVVIMSMVATKLYKKYAK
jgi:hypothetical protein